MSGSRFRSLLICGGLLVHPVLVASGAQAAKPSGDVAAEPFEANERLEIPTIHTTLRVAEQNEIPILLHASGLQKLLTTQSIDFTDPYGFSGNEQTLEVLHHSDGSTSVNIVPIRLGKNTLEFFATFADGGFAMQKASFDVGPSTIAPALLAYRGDTTWLDVDDKEHASSHVVAEAFYYDLRPTIVVPPAYLKLRVLESTGGSPVVEVDPAAEKINALRTGDALVEATYAGARMLTCFQVRHGPYSGDISNCRELRHLNELMASAPLNETWLSDPRGYDHQFSLTANIDFCAKRLSVTAPDHPVGLGQRIRIPIVLTDDRIRFVWFVQSTYEGNGIGMPPIRDANGVFLEGSVGHTVNALRDGGETGKYIEVVPLALGNVEIAVVANFEDGGFDRRFFRMKVVPSSQGLESFQGYEPYPLTPPEDKEPEGRHATALMAQVTYKGIQDAIRLYSLQGVKFSIQQPPGPPVIEVDDKGQVRALRRGKATVEADFDGTKWSYPIHVSGESH